MKYIEIALGVTEAPSLPAQLVEEITLSVCAGDKGEEKKQLSQVHFAYSLLTSLISGPLELTISVLRLTVLACNLGWDWVKNSLLNLIPEEKESFWLGIAYMFLTGLIYLVWGAVKLLLLFAQAITGFVAALIHPLIRPITTFKRLKKLFFAEEKKYTATSVKTLAIESTVGVAASTVSSLNLLGTGLVSTATKFLAGVVFPAVAWKAIIATALVVYTPSIFGQIALEIDGVRAALPKIKNKFTAWLEKPKQGWENLKALSAAKQSHTHHIQNSSHAPKDADIFAEQLLGKNFYNHADIKNNLIPIIQNKDHYKIIAHIANSITTYTAHELSNVTQNITDFLKDVLKAQTEHIKKMTNFSGYMGLNANLLTIIHALPKNVQTDLLIQHAKIFNVNLDSSVESHLIERPTFTKMRTPKNNQGTHGAISIGRFINKNNQTETVAIKSIDDKPDETIDDFNGEKFLAYNEFYFLFLSKGLPFIVQLYYFWVNSENISKPEIAMQYAKNGDLFYIIKNLKNNFNQTLSNHNKQHYQKQITQGLAYLHQKGIIHRDLNLRNIFVDENNNILIGDLASAITLETLKNEKNYWTHEFLQTPVHAPPAVLELERKPNYLNPSPYSQASDIWALSVVLFTIQTGVYPYPTSVKLDCASEILNHLIKYTYPCSEVDLKVIHGCSSNFINLMLQCWQMDPTTRITTDGGFTKITQDTESSTSTISTIYSFH
jgi:hypothetical protein